MKKNQIMWVVRCNKSL